MHPEYQDLRIGSSRELLSDLIIRVIAGAISLIIVAPPLGYLAVRGGSRGVVVMLTVISVPTTMLAVERFVNWLRSPYDIKYTTFSRALGGSISQAQLRYKVSILQMSPTENLQMEFRDMEEGLEIRRTIRWGSILRDCFYVLGAGWLIDCSISSRYNDVTLAVVIALCGAVFLGLVMAPSKRRDRAGSSRIEVLAGMIFDSPETYVSSRAPGPHQEY